MADRAPVYHLYKACACLTLPFFVYSDALVGVIANFLAICGSDGAIAVAVMLHSLLTLSTFGSTAKADFIGCIVSLSMCVLGFSALHATALQRRREFRERMAELHATRHGNFGGVFTDRDGPSDVEDERVQVGNPDYHYTMAMSVRQPPPPEPSAFGHPAGAAAGHSPPVAHGPPHPHGAPPLYAHGEAAAAGAAADGVPPVLFYSPIVAVSDLPPQLGVPVAGPFANVTPMPMGPVVGLDGHPVLHPARRTASPAAHRPPGASPLAPHGSESEAQASAPQAAAMSSTDSNPPSSVVASRVSLLRSSPLPPPPPHPQSSRPSPSSPPPTIELRSPLQPSPSLQSPNRFADPSRLPGGVTVITPPPPLAAAHGGGLAAAAGSGAGALAGAPRAAAPHTLHGNALGVLRSLRDGGADDHGSSESDNAPLL